MQTGKHTGEKPFQCKKCRETFGDTTTLKRHEKSHDKDKPFKCKRCKQCEKCFRRSSSLMFHRTIHTENNPFDLLQY